MSDENWKKIEFIVDEIEFIFIKQKLLKQKFFTIIEKKPNECDFYLKQFLLVLK